MSSMPPTRDVHGSKPRHVAKQNTKGSSHRKQRNVRRRTSINAALIVPNTTGLGRAQRKQMGGRYGGATKRSESTKDTPDKGKFPHDTLIEDREADCVIATMKTVEGVRLTVTKRGDLTLWEEGDVPRQVSVSTLSLPEICKGMLPCVLFKKQEKGEYADEMEIRWGPKESPLAVLEVVGHHVIGHGHDWSEVRRCARRYVGIYEYSSVMKIQDNVNITFC